MPASRRSALWFCALLLLSLIAFPGYAQKTKSKTAISMNKALPAIAVAVDATEAPRRIFHATLRIPVVAGPLTLYYPKWIPGEHMASGPIVDSMGLHFKAGGQEIPWRRDLVEMYSYHLNIPDGVSELEVSMDQVTGSSGIFSSGSSATPQLAVVSWNQLLLYPAGYTSDQLQYKASLKLPPGWKFGTPLPVARQSGDSVEFAPVTLTTLVDSPVIAGAHYKVVNLTEAGRPPVEMNIAADSDAALAMSPDQEKHFRQLVAEATAVFGAHHYTNYHFLFSLSDHVAHFGLEHHECNDSRSGERSFIDDDEYINMGSLLPHEYVHSWNGKYRRPAGLMTSNYDVPMKDDLLWIYEGMTNFWGDVLQARSGLFTQEQARESLANTAADMDHTPGRSWRPLQDTNDSVPVLGHAGSAWAAWRRSLDYYPEGTLIWLEVDTIIRQQTRDQKSLDDFSKLFHGGADTPFQVKGYTLDDVVATLNQVAPGYDWKTYFQARLTSTNVRAPLGGIENGGWKLVYNDTPNPVVQADEHESKEVDLEYSLGLFLRQDGSIRDTIADLPAAQAGLAPGMKVVAVNGRKYSGDVIHDALKAAVGSRDPIEVLVENAEFFKSYRIDYHGGDKYPHLVRDESKPDLLGEIFKQHAGAVK